MPTSALRQGRQCPARGAVATFTIWAVASLTAKSSGRLVVLVIGVVAALWLVAAVYVGADFLGTGFDDDCYRGRPGWAALQAAVAALGIFIAIRSLLLLRRERPWRHWLSTAAVLLAVWIVIAGVAAPGITYVFCPGQPPESI